MSPPSPPESSLPRLLVVADDLLLNQALRRVLSPHFQVSFARTVSTTALLLSASEPVFDVILCEMGLTDGQATELLPLLEPWRSRIAFFTGMSLHLPEVQQLVNAGFPVWTKPLHLDDLRDQLGRLTPPDCPPAQAA